MSAHPTMTYVIAAYNEATSLPDSIPRIVQRLRELPGSEVVIVENGSTDATGAVAAGLAQTYGAGPVIVRHETSAKGLGNALRRGLEVAQADRVMLTAADLPFGFSDLDAALALNPIPGVVAGSKAHPESKVNVTFQRRVMSRGLWVLRRVMFGLDIGDSQGSVNIERTLGQSLLPDLATTGYFISTEVVVLAAKAGATVVEVPVDYSAPRTDSKVNPVRDSLDVVREMWALRSRISARRSR